MADDVHGNAGGAVQRRVDASAGPVVVPKLVGLARNRQHFAGKRGFTDRGAVRVGNVQVGVKIHAHVKHVVGELRVQVGSDCTDAGGWR